MNIIQENEIDNPDNQYLMTYLNNVHEMSRDEANDIVNTRQKFITEYENFPEAKLMKDRSPKTNTKLWGSIQNYIFKTPYIQMIYVIQNLCKTKKSINGKYNEIKTQLDLWLNTNDKSLTFIEILRDNPIEYWKTMQHDDEFGLLAIVALILLNLPASEAQCERLISKHRMAMNDQQKSMKCETAAARVRLSSIRIPGHRTDITKKMEKFMKELNKRKDNI